VKENIAIRTKMPM